jgi:hypothetical protein
MSKTQLLDKFRHHEIVKMTTMVCDNGLRDTKSSNDMIEYEKCCSFPGIIKYRHCLDPFSEIIHGYDNVSMPPGQVRITCHEVNAPFSKWTNGKYKVKRSRMRSDLIVIWLKSMAFLNGSNAILKQRRPQVTGS